MFSHRIPGFATPIRVPPSSPKNGKFFIFHDVKGEVKIILKNKRYYHTIYSVKWLFRSFDILQICSFTYTYLESLQIL